MSERKNTRIDAAAGVAMAEWESLFSSELLAQAKVIASQSTGETVSVQHLREAVGPAVEKLLTAVNGQESDGKRKAA